MRALRRVIVAVMVLVLSAASLAQGFDGAEGPHLRLAADPASTNYSDIWWNPGESGWGITIADHETQIFAVWYTYEADGRPTWFVIPGGTFSQDRRIFTGTVYRTRGPCYRNATFDTGQVTATPVGTATIDFAPTDLQAGWARFSGSIGGTSWSKAITRQPFGNSVPDWGTDFTDIWWNSAESGWGLALSQHGNNVFGVLFTYDCDGSPLFVALPGVTFQSQSAFSGTLYTTTSSSGWWGSPAFNTSGVTAIPAGTSSIAFNGRNGQFNYTINGASRASPIGQQPFGNARPAVPSTTKSLAVSLGGAGSGSVSSSPAGISCRVACSASFADGSTVVLTALASQGSRFAGWGGDCASAGTGACTLVMSSARNATANFTVAPPPTTPAAQACTGQYSMTVNIGFMGCANASYTFTGSLRIDGINFDAASSNAPSQFAGTLTVTNVSDMFTGFPGTCLPANPRTVQAPFNGFMNISRIGSADAFVLDEELHFQFSLGSMNTVLGTITGPEVTVGTFSCTY